jgi:hypothetical protein
LEGGVLGRGGGDLLGLTALRAGGVLGRGGDVLGFELTDFDRLFDLLRDLDFEPLLDLDFFFSPWYSSLYPL